MFSATRLNVLRQRRQELLAASEAHRRLLSVECIAVQQRLEWLDRTVTAARRLRPFISLATPLLGIWAARRRNRGRSWIGNIASALPAGERYVSAVREFIHR
jgi:hypothetical protein